MVGRTPKFILIAYLAAAVAAELTDVALARGEYLWGNIAGALYAVAFILLAWKSPKRGWFLMLSMPALAVAENAVILPVLMAVPYFFSNTV